MRPITELARWFAAVRFARTVDAFVVPGTGILDDFGTAPHEMPYDMFRWSAAARLAGRPWAMVGIGAGPIEHRASRWMMRQTVRSSSHVTYRDDVSRAFMASIGEPAPPVSVQPDVVFALPPPDSRPRSDRSKAEVGLGLMAYYGWRNDPRAGAATFDRYLEAMVDVALRLIASDHTVRVLVGQLADETAVARFTSALERELGDEWRRSVAVEPIGNFGELLDQVAQTDAVVATRYHNVIAGLMLARPTVAIGYADKFVDVMRSAGLADFCHDVERVESSAIVRDLDALLARRDEVSEELALRARDNSVAVESRLAAVLDDLLGGGRAGSDDVDLVPLGAPQHSPAGDNKDGYV
jgi:polysaccharide pyruvyl transferase WcaK-like protein